MLRKSECNELVLLPKAQAGRSPTGRVRMAQTK
jgi:hypothetical protein